jgi:hypothetical protein
MSNTIDHPLHGSPFVNIKEKVIDEYMAYKRGKNQRESDINKPNHIF